MATRVPPPCLVSRETPPPWSSAIFLTRASPRPLPLVLVEKLDIDRDAFVAELRRENIGAGLHFPAVHLSTLYQALGFRAGQFPNAEYVCERILSLPLFPKMTDEDLDSVIRAVKKVIAKHLR